MNIDHDAIVKTLEDTVQAIIDDPFVNNGNANFGVEWKVSRIVIKHALGGVCRHLGETALDRTEAAVWLGLAARCASNPTEHAALAVRWVARDLLHRNDIAEAAVHMAAASDGSTYDQEQSLFLLVRWASTVAAKMPNGSDVLQEIARLLGGVAAKAKTPQSA